MKLITIILGMTGFALGVRAAEPTTAPTSGPAENIPQIIQSDPQIHLTFGHEHLILPGGLQPSMLCTKTGALIVQAQIPQKTPPTTRMAYPTMMATYISRDTGETWTRIPLAPNAPILNLEGGAIQLHDGSIIALDTYVTPGPTPDSGVGQLYISKDDWQTLEGPTDVPFELPNIDFRGTDDGGHPHSAQRLHRRIIELPNGDLLTTMYGHMIGDDTPSTYQHTMKKSRVMLFRSSDQGQHWKFIATVAADSKVGTEGFGEPVLCRISKGDHPGRLLCLMRTGRELFETTSDDEGKTWQPPHPRVFAGLDVYRTDLWIDQLRTFKDFHGKPLDESNLDELRGAVVDPDLIETRGGLLVAAFGVRVPQKLCWQHPEFPWNGNYIAISRDHGQTWSHVARITSGVLTTHYMAIEETPTDNALYITYDLGGWSKGMRRDVFGRTLKIEPGTRQ